MFYRAEISTCYCNIYYHAEHGSKVVRQILYT